MGSFNSQQNKTPEDHIIDGWRAGMADALASICGTLAQKVRGAQRKGGMTQTEAMRMPPPQTARDYYYEARGLVNAVYNICSRNKLPMHLTPEQAVEGFWDHDLTSQELSEMLQDWLKVMIDNNIPSTD